jgi:hypothetical protein
MQPFGKVGVVALGPLSGPPVSPWFIIAVGVVGIITVCYKNRAPRASGRMPTSIPMSILYSLIYLLLLVYGLVQLLH